VSRSVTGGKNEQKTRIWEKTSWPERVLMSRGGSSSRQRLKYSSQFIPDYHIRAPGTVGNQIDRIGSFRQPFGSAVRDGALSRTAGTENRKKEATGRTLLSLAVSDSQIGRRGLLELDVKIRAGRGGKDWVGGK